MEPVLDQFTFVLSNTRPGFIILSDLRSEKIEKYPLIYIYQQTTYHTHNVCAKNTDLGHVPNKNGKMVLNTAVYVLFLFINH